MMLRPSAWLLMSALPFLGGCASEPAPILSELPFQVLEALERPVGPPPGTQWSPAQMASHPYEVLTPSSLGTHSVLGPGSVPDRRAGLIRSVEGSVAYEMELLLEEVDDLDGPSPRQAWPYLQSIEADLLAPLIEAGLRPADTHLSMLDQDCHHAFRLHGLEGAILIEGHGYLSMESRKAVVFLRFRLESPGGFRVPLEPTP